MKFTTCTVSITGFAPYSASRAHQSVRGENEPWADFEKRCWKEHLHTDLDGNIVVPGPGIKQAIDYAAQRLSLKKDGKSKWTSDINSGVSVMHDMNLTDKSGAPIHSDAATAVTIFAHTNGDRKSGSRQNRIFPLIPAPWFGKFELLLVNSTIPQSVIEQIVTHAGLIAGLGRFRPERSGSNGRFEVTSFAWREGAR